MAGKKPNFIVIGAMKAATTSLYTYIKQHPEIFMTKVKEPMFFNKFQQENNYKIFGSKRKKPITLEEYLTMFKDVKKDTIFLQNVVTDLLLGLGMNNFFVDPVPHDGGTAIGAALWLDKYDTQR